MGSTLIFRRSHSHLPASDLSREKTQKTQRDNRRRQQALVTSVFFASLRGHDNFLKGLLFALIILVHPHPASGLRFGPVRGRACAGRPDCLLAREPTCWPRPWR